MELRCQSRMGGVVDLVDNTIEIKCSAKKCGAGGGTVVLHKFNLSTGKLVGTEKYRNPDPSRVTNRKKGTP